MAKPTLFSWATSPTSPIIYPASAFVTGGYPNRYEIPAAEYNATMNRIGEWITYIDPYIGTLSGQLFASAIRPYGTSLQDGIYLPGATYAMDMRAFGALGIRLTVNTAASTWTWNAAGTMTGFGWTAVDWGASLPGHSNLAAALTTATKLRYAYAATKPTFEMDFSPVNGGYVVASHTWQLDLEQSVAGEAVLAKGSAGAADVSAYRPLQLLHDTARTTETVYEAVSLVANLKTADAANYARVRLMKRDKSTRATTAVLTCSTVSTAFATVTDNNGGTPIVLDRSAYTYFLSIESANSTAVHFATFREVTLNLRKSAVE